MEIVFSAPDYDTLYADAQRLGFVNEAGDIIVAGPMASGGNYFLNLVGIVYEPQLPVPEGEDPLPPVPRPGFFGRLRANGETGDLPSFSSAITQYVYSAELGGWTADGVTLAPEWVGDIGVIA